jgi:hypothetical protein
VSAVWLADRRGQQGSDPPPPEADLCCEAEAVGWGEEVDILPPGPRPKNAENFTIQIDSERIFFSYMLEAGKVLGGNVQYLKSFS